MKCKSTIPAKQQDIQDDLNMGGSNGFNCLLEALNEFDAIELELTNGTKVYASTEEELKTYFCFK